MTAQQTETAGGVGQEVLTRDDQIRRQKREYKQRLAKLTKDKDEFYNADQEEEDYALSTEDDSGAVMSGSCQREEMGEDDLQMMGDEKESTSEQREDKGSSNLGRSRAETKKA